MSRLLEYAPATLTRSLALAGLVAAACLGASAASAADCVNGYRTIGNDVIVLCDPASDPLGSTALYGTAPGTAAPAITGSVPAPAARTAPRNLMAESPADCQPGQYWSYDLAESGNVMLRC